jgi:hypothetical protein
MGGVYIGGRGGWTLGARGAALAKVRQGGGDLIGDGLGYCYKCFFPVENRYFTELWQDVSGCAREGQVISAW